jgi:hypothetical protein
MFFHLLSQNSKQKSFHIQNIRKTAELDTSITNLWILSYPEENRKIKGQKKKKKSKN